MSLILLSKYLVEDFGGDIKKAKDIPPFHSDKEAGGKAHRILLWYEKQLSEKQWAFMKVFSLFRQAVREEHFEGVFRAKMESEMNQTLREMSGFSFKRMVDNLCDRRLISKGQDDTYATHPLVKNYFESIFEEEEKKQCHKRIYQYFGEYAPEQPETLEGMQPLFEQVYHGCAAGLYDEVYWPIYVRKIGGEPCGYKITQKLAAWEINMTLVRTLFPEGDLSQMPLVREKSDQSWLLNAAGLALLSIGRLKEAEEPLKAAIELYIEDNQIAYASVGYLNLTDLQFRSGELESGRESAKKALDAAEKAKSDWDIMSSKAYLAWILLLLGKGEEAGNWFRQADELEGKISGYRLYSQRGVNYAVFLVSMKRIDEAFELTKQNLEICRDMLKSPADTSRCYRCLGAIERIKGNHKKAEDHLQNALAIARKVGMPVLEIEALLESSRLHIGMERNEDSIRYAKEVLKICDRTGFKLYEPEAEIVLGKAYLALKDVEQAKNFAHSAYEKAIGMNYRWAEGDAAHLLGEIYLKKADKESAGEWLEKAVACRKEILDPEVKESERMLEWL